MYCSNCGAQIADNAGFCPKCGQPTSGHAQSTQPQQPQQPQQSWQASQANPTPGYDPLTAQVEKYRTLGGWLLFFVICMILSAITFVGTAISSVSGAIALSGSSYYLPGYETSMWILAAESIVGAVLETVTAYFVIKRDSRFLFFDQLNRIISLVLTIIVAFLGSNGEVIGTLVSAVLGFFLMTLYYQRSVRVRTYMGSDEYLQRAIFKYQN